MVKEPAPTTLARYGLTLEAWKSLLRVQNRRCGVCGKDPSRLVIDHEHVKGWKDMPDDLRVIYVRGLCCPSCNHFVLTRYADAEKHRQAARFLDDYAERRDEALANRD